MTATERLYRLLDYFYSRRGKPIDSYDEELQELLEIGQRQLARELKALNEHYDFIVQVSQGRRIAYKLIERNDIIHKAFQTKSLQLGMLFEMAKEGMPEIIEEWRKITQHEQSPYLFFNTPYEEIKELEKNSNFRSLKKAIEEREYRDIRLKGREQREFHAIKPVKLIFSEGNWYIAYVDCKQLRLSRINFIDRVSYSKGKINFSQDSIAPYLQWLESRFQNSFSRYDLTPKRAFLKAQPNIAHYFQPTMKKFFKSQRYIETLEDGTIRLSIDYTQAMEILPFVQRWMPDLIIESPDSLKEQYRAKLLKALDSTV